MSPALRVSVELRADDLDRLRRCVLTRAAGHAAELLAREDEILGAALEYARRAAERAPLAFIHARLARLETVVEMLRDKDWTLPGSVHRRALATLAFLVDPMGLVPDRAPVFGYLDDAVIAELLCTEVRHELDGYCDYCAFRDDASRRRPERESADGALFERRLAMRRKRIRARIQAREYRYANRNGHGHWNAPLGTASIRRRLRSLLRLGG